jgi:cell division septum initiation protein DivIVA
MENVAGHVNSIVDELYELLQNARSVPLSSDKCIVERDKALDILDDIISSLPNELENAKKICESRNELISQARREAETLVGNARREADELQARSRADAESRLSSSRSEAENIIASARTKAQELVTKEAIYKEAQEQSRQMIESTNAKIEELKNASNKYMDDALKQTEESIAASLRDVQATRAKFKALTGGKPAQATTAPSTRKASMFADIDV